MATYSSGPGRQPPGFKRFPELGRGARPVHHRSRLAQLLALRQNRVPPRPLVNLRHSKPTPNTLRLSCTSHHPVNPDSDKKPNPENTATPKSDDAPANQANPVHPVNPDSDNNTADNPILNPEFVVENLEVSLARIQRRMHIEDGSVHYRDYAGRHAKESESIY